MFRPLIAATLVIALAGGCGDKTFAPGTAAEGASPAPPRDLAQSEKPVGDPRELLENLSQDLLDKLKEVETDEEAALLEEEIWDAWLVSGSATVDTLMKRGLEYQQAEDLEGARDAFDRAIALKPDYAEAWNRRAVLFFEDGKYDEAVADLESAHARCPFSPPQRLALAARLCLVRFGVFFKERDDGAGHVLARRPFDAFQPRRGVDLHDNRPALRAQHVNTRHIEAHGLAGLQGRRLFRC